LVPALSLEEHACVGWRAPDDLAAGLAMVR
jgi:hypothetical protein